MVTIKNKGVRFWCYIINQVYVFFWYGKEGVYWSKNIFKISWKLAIIVFQTDCSIMLLSVLMWTIERTDYLDNIRFPIFVRFGLTFLSEANIGAFVLVLILFKCCLVLHSSYFLCRHIILLYVAIPFFLECKSKYFLFLA